VLKRTVAWCVALLLSSITIFTTGLAVNGQSSSGDPRVFLTGFVVQGEFLRFFERHGEIEIFGYPLTVEFEEAGQRVQYFHRGRMELLPDNPPGQRVALARLGELLITPEPAIPRPETRPDRRFFAETGHTVASAFLRYFESRGGVELFGYPITEMKVENGRIVQYFQRARLEWHPDSPPGLQVQLGKLGEIYLDQFPPPPEVRDPASNGNRRVVPPKVTSLNVVASVRYPYAGQNEPQALYVFVYDQDGNPVPGAQVRAVIHSPEGEHEILLAETNELGLSWQTFEVGQVPMGKKVAVEALASYGGVEGETRTSFVVWL